MTKESVGETAFMANAAKLSFVLAAFHTCFNLINTFILIWFISFIEKLVCKVIKSKAVSDEDEPRLRYIQGGLMKTPEISVFQAQKEITLFCERIQGMFNMVKELYAMSDEEKENPDFEKLFNRIEKYEGISDNMEIEIAHYLEQVSNAHLSDDTKGKIRQMMREISEIESIGDACYNLARTIRRKKESGKAFTETLQKNVKEMFHLTDNSLTQMNHVMKGRREEVNVKETFKIEADINAMRNNLKISNIQAINNHEYDYSVGAIFTDLISECEKLGDYVVNVVEARTGL